MIHNARVSRSVFSVTVLAIMSLSVAFGVQGASSGTRDLWGLAQRHASTLRFSTLFTAQNVRDFLSTPEGIDKAIQWCKDTAVTHVYLETFRDSYTVDRDVLLNAKQRFVDAGFLVSGCVTTTRIGRKSVEGWIFPCFTEQAGLDNLKRILEFTAGLFDEIMIDDFFATHCECEDCIQARGDRPWSEFRCDMLVDVSRRDVLEPARKVNPAVKIIIKYPQWYEDFHNRGYEVVRQSQMFEKIWVGTETRDPDSERWGRKSQYEAYFIMRWLGEIGGEKCGGGWFDPYGTSPPTYVEQARQTILAGAKESLLFCYGSLQKDTGPANVRALRKELPQLFQLADLIHDKSVRGILAPKPPNSDGDGDRYVYDFVGMLGLPLVPSASVRDDVPAAFLPVQTLKDPRLVAKLGKMLDDEKPLLITNHLADKLPESIRVRLTDAEVLDVPDDLWSLMDLPSDKLRTIRERMLKPFGIEFDAPTRVALYLFGDDLVVIENFNDTEIETVLTIESRAKPTVALTIPAKTVSISAEPGSAKVQLPGRSLVALRFAR